MTTEEMLVWPGPFDATTDREVLTTTTPIEITNQQQSCQEKEARIRRSRLENEQLKVMVDQLESEHNAALEQLGNDREQYAERQHKLVAEISRLDEERRCLLARSRDLKVDRGSPHCVGTECGCWLVTPNGSDDEGEESGESVDLQASKLRERALSLKKEMKRDAESIAIVIGDWMSHDQQSSEAGGGKGHHLESELARKREAAVRLDMFPSELIGSMARWEVGLENRRCDVRREGKYEEPLVDDDVGLLTPKALGLELALLRNKFEGVKRDRDDLKDLCHVLAVQCLAAQRGKMEAVVELESEAETLRLTLDNWVSHVIDTEDGEVL